MGAIETETHAYLRPPEPYFWRWSDSGDAIGWPDNVTIAFREELLPILERLAVEGLPRLGSLLLLLAACRANWLTAPGRRGILAGILKQGVASIQSVDLELLNEVCDRLDELSKSVSSNAVTSAWKAELCESVLGVRLNRTEVLNSSTIVAGLQIGLDPEQLNPYLEKNPESILRRDLVQLVRRTPAIRRRQHLAADENWH